MHIGMYMDIELRLGVMLGAFYDHRHRNGDAMLGGAKSTRVAHGHDRAQGPCFNSHCFFFKVAVQGA